MTMGGGSLDELLRAYVKSSETSLDKIDGSLDKIDRTLDDLRTSFLLHKADDEHALRQIHKRLDELEDAQEVTGQHAIDELKTKVKDNEALKSKAFDVTLKILGFVGALAVGFLARHLFFK
jgi:hypothetical protein